MVPDGPKLIVERVDWVNANTSVEEFALNVRFVAPAWFHGLPTAAAVIVHVPSPILMVRAPDPLLLNAPLSATLLSFAAKSNVPVNADMVMPPAVSVPPPIATVTVLPLQPVQASNVRMFDAIGSHEQVDPFVVLDQCALSVARSSVPVPPIQKHVPLATAQLIAHAGADSANRNPREMKNRRSI